MFKDDLLLLVGRQQRVVAFREEVNSPATLRAMVSFVKRALAGLPTESDDLTYPNWMNRWGMECL